MWQDAPATSHLVCQLQCVVAVAVPAKKLKGVGQAGRGCCKDGSGAAVRGWGDGSWMTWSRMVFLSEIADLGLSIPQRYVTPGCQGNLCLVPSFLIFHLKILAEFSHSSSRWGYGM